MINKIYVKIKEFIKENYIFLIIISIIFLTFTIKLPYVVYTPGGNINLNDRIEIIDSTSSEGSFNMAYVTMYNGSIPAILMSFILPDWDLTKTSDITLDNQSIEELFILDRIMLESSIDSAMILAYNKAEKEIEITKEVLNVIYIDELADTDIEVGDTILSINGQEITKLDEINNILADKIVGDEIEIIVLRDDKEVKTNSVLQLMDDTAKIGIAFVNTFEYDEEPNAEITSKASESGPSGGLMLSLSIYDKLIEEDLTQGRKIVGTGTIDSEGIVGEIDGIKYKLLGSTDADIFLCPEANYEEAVKVKEEFDLEMEIYSVETFDEAVKILE